MASLEEELYRKLYTTFLDRMRSILGSGRPSEKIRKLKEDVVTIAESIEPTNYYPYDTMRISLPAGTGKSFLLRDGTCVSGVVIYTAPHNFGEDFTPALEVIFPVNDNYIYERMGGTSERRPISPGNVKILENTLPI